MPNCAEKFQLYVVAPFSILSLMATSIYFIVLPSIKINSCPLEPAVPIFLIGEISTFLISQFSC